MLESMLMTSSEIRSNPDLTLALMQAPSGFKELCFNKTITKKKSPVLSNTFGKFDGASFNCINGYIGIGALADFVFTKNDEFTIEQWQYVNDFGYDCWLIGKGGDTSSCFKTYTSNSYLQTEGNYISAATTAVMAAKTWQHVAIVQHAGVIKVYVNGVVKLATVANANFGTIASLLTFGGGSSLQISCNGYIDQMRVSRVARYTANFIPPIEPFIID